MRSSIRLALLLLAFPAATQAGTVVPNAYAAVSGDTGDYGLLGNGFSLDGATIQVGYAASEFSGVGVGSLITGVGIRLPANHATITNDLSYTDFSIEVGKAANAIGSFSSTFANNVTGGVTVRSGAMTIAGGSLIGGASVNPFYVINFTTPYAYQGGDLVITFRRSSSYYGAPVDAISLPNAAVDTVVGSGSNAGGGMAQSIPAPILDLQISAVAVPEPSSIAMAGIGLAALSGLGWLRRRAA